MLRYYQQVTDEDRREAALRAQLGQLPAPSYPAGEATDDHQPPVEGEFAESRSAVGEILPLVRRIVACYQPRQIWLFGSRARGDNRPDSDWDLLAVVDDATPDEMFDPDVMWRLLELRNFYADVVLLPASDFDEDVDTPNTLAWPVKREGRLLYER